MEQKSSNFKGIMLIVKEMLRYWYLLILVVVFIVAATYLNVKAPVLMGESIDKMITYAGEQTQKDLMLDIKSELDAGQDISKENLDTLAEYKDASTESAQMYETLTTTPKEELKITFDTLELASRVYSLDKQSIDNGNGLSEKQVDYINNDTKALDVSKMVLLSTPAESLKEVTSSASLMFVNQADIDSKYNVFLDSIKYLLLAYLLYSISNFIYNVLMARVSAITAKNLRNNLFHKLETLSIRFFDQSNDGDLLSRFTNDIDNINNALNQTLVQIMSQISMLIGVMIMMFREDTSTGEIFGIHVNNLLSWNLLLFAIGAIIIALIIITLAARFINTQQEKLGDLNGFVDERISAQKVIITNNLKDETMDGFDDFNNDYRKTSFMGQALSGLIMPIMIGIGLINLAFIVIDGSNAVIDGMNSTTATNVMTVGMLVTFITYSQNFFAPLGQIFSQFNIVQLAITGAARVYSVLQVNPEIKESKDAVVIDGIKENIVLDNVSFGYSENKPVLKNVNLTVYNGKKVALVGPTGSGKTTIMNLLNRFYDVNEGEIRFGDTNINDMTLESLRKNVGIVLQESVLFTGTIAENIAYGKENATFEEIEDAAKTANIHEFIMTLDDGYETEVSNETTLFSVGQKQLMSIARTILTNPDLLILDEATSNVDTVTEAKIQKAMENVMKGRTSFVIAHRLKTILDSNLIVVLKDGEVIEQGNHEELLEQDGFYAELYYNQFVLD